MTGERAEAEIAPVQPESTRKLFLVRHLESTGAPALGRAEARKLAQFTKQRQREDHQQHRHQRAACEREQPRRPRVRVAPVVIFPADDRGHRPRAHERRIDAIEHRDRQDHRDDLFERAPQGC